MNINQVRKDLELAEQEMLARLAADNALEWGEYVKFLTTELNTLADRLEQEAKDEDL